jgi:tocopherol cyclase
VGYLTSTFHPEGFHGAARRERFFEGWYLKCVSADRRHRWAFIPGLFLGATGEAEAFVQVLDGTTHRSWYHRFPREAFRAEEDRFEVQVGENHFDARGMALELDGGALRGALTFNDGGGLTGWPVTAWSPGIMGPFGYLPFMECSHGLISFSHTLQGSLMIEGQPISFDGGLGYIEKDWGAAFPTAYVWMQSNHFSHARACLSASIAIIPTLPQGRVARGLDVVSRRLAGRPMSSFRGFIIGLWLDGELHAFATWSGARTERLLIDDSHVRWTVSSATERLELVTERVAGGLLHAPVRTEMHRRVVESIDARIEVRLTRRSGEVLFEEVGTCGGLEVFGDLAHLQSFA